MTDQVRHTLDVDGDERRCHQLPLLEPQASSEIEKIVTAMDLALHIAQGRGLILAVDLGYISDRVLCDFEAEDVARVAHTGHAWKCGEAVDEPGYAAAATQEDICAHVHELTPAAM